MERRRGGEEERRRGGALLTLRGERGGITDPESGEIEGGALLALPVEMWLILSARPACSTAATESPPPMMVIASMVDSVLAMLNVPLANASISNTPMGPFQITLLHSPSSCV